MGFWVSMVAVLLIVTLMNVVWGSGIKRILNAAEEYGILKRHGSPKSGYWEIVDKDLQE